MTHSEMDELYELYLLGTLEFEQASEISEHLSRQCSYCLTQLRESSAVVESLATLVELTPPPADLRARVMSLSAPPARAVIDDAPPARVLTMPAPRSQSQWAMAFALACAASLALVFWGLSQRDRLEELTRQRNELRSTLAILSEADNQNC